MRQPDVTADHTVIADINIAAQDRSSCVDHNIISDIRMTLNAFDQCAILLCRKALRA